MLGALTVAEKEEDGVHPDHLARREREARIARRPLPRGARTRRRRVNRNIDGGERQSARPAHVECVRCRPQLLIHAHAGVVEADARADERGGEDEPVAEEWERATAARAVWRADARRERGATEVRADPHARDGREACERALGIIHVREAPVGRVGAPRAVRAVRCARRARRTLGAL